MLAMPLHLQVSRARWLHMLMYLMKILPALVLKLILEELIVTCFLTLFSFSSSALFHCSVLPNLSCHLLTPTFFCFISIFPYRSVSTTLLMYKWDLSHFFILENPLSHLREAIRLFWHNVPFVNPGPFHLVLCLTKKNNLIILSPLVILPCVEIQQKVEVDHVHFHLGQVFKHIDRKHEYKYVYVHMSVRCYIYTYM